MLKISSTKSAEFRKGGVEVGGDSKIRRNRIELNGNEIDGGKIGDNKFGKKV